MSTVRYLLSYYAQEVYDGNSQYSQVMRSALQSLSVIAEGNYDNVDEFLSDIQDLNHSLSGRVRLSNPRVVITTVHDFKGKEADSVYVWNDSEGVFPYKASESEAEIEEERRLHYIACTRATQVSSIMALSGNVGQFVTEMDLEGATRLEGPRSGTLGKTAISEKSTIFDLLLKEQDESIA